MEDWTSRHLRQKRSLSDFDASAKRWFMCNTNMKGMASSIPATELTSGIASSNGSARTYPLNFCHKKGQKAQKISRIYFELFLAKNSSRGGCVSLAENTPT